MLCKNISRSVLAIEKTSENSAKNSFQDHRLRIDGKTPWRCQRNKSESSVHSFQDHLGNHHGDKENGHKCPSKDSFKTIHQKSGKSVLSRPSTKCAKNRPKSSSSKTIKSQNMQKKGSFKTIEDGSQNDTSFKTIGEKGQKSTSFKSITNRVKNLNPQYMVPIDEVSQVISDPKSRKKAQPVTKQPSSGPPPPGSRFKPIYMEPGSVSIDSTRDLQAMFPNSFDCIRDMQGEYNIKTDPTAPPVQHARWKVPIKYKEEIEKELAEMVWQRMITKQTEPTPWVSSLTYPKKANGKLRICFAWDENTNTCFQKIKSQLQKALLRPLRYYDLSKPVTLQCDATLKGPGVCIIQDGQPIAFASKSLMDTETHCANIEN